MTPAVRAATRNVTAWPRTTTADASATAGQRLPVQQPGADVGRDRVPHPRQREPARQPRPADEDDADGRRGERDRHQRHGRAHGRRQHEEDGDRQHGLHELPGRAFPADGPQGPADVVARRGRG